MKVWEILRNKGSEVVTVGSDATVFEVIGLFARYSMGAVVVMGSDANIEGIITERDVLRRCLPSSHPDLDVCIKDFMTTDLIVGVEDDTARYVMGIMTKNRIRHLPIVDKGGDKLVGIISIGDVVKVQLEETEFENRFLREYIQGNP